MTLTCTNVTLRQKPLRNDRISLYLDYYPAIRNPYTMKMSRREFLGIYIYAKPKNEQQRMFNQKLLDLVLRYRQTLFCSTKMIKRTVYGKEN